MIYLIFRIDTLNYFCQAKTIYTVAVFNDSKNVKELFIDKSFS